MGRIFVSKNSVCSGVGAEAETPNTKHQTPRKPQTPNLRLVEPPVWSLGLGAFLEFGVWCLVFFLLTQSTPSQDSPPHPSAGNRARHDETSALCDRSRADGESSRAGRGRG